MPERRRICGDLIALVDKITFFGAEYVILEDI